MKECHACKELLELNMFSVNNKNKDGLYHICRNCSNKRSALNRTKAKDKNPEQFRVRQLLYTYRQTDKAKGIKCCLTNAEAYELTAKPCHYCGDKKRIGLDRINNNLGHSKENVVPCCADCNRLRTHLLSQEEMLLLIPVVKQIKSNRKATGLPALTFYCTLDN